MSTTLLFDIDGTLLNSGKAGQNAMEATLQRVFGISKLDHDIQTSGRTDRAIITDLFDWHGLELTPEAVKKFQTSYFELLPDHLETGGGRVFDGVTELLNAVTESGNDHVGLLTGNFEQSGWMKVQHYQLDHHFSFGAFGDEHVDRDDVARLAAAELNRRGITRFDDVWILGDTPADIQCARAIDAKVLAVATGTYSLQELEAAQPDVLVADFSDLPALREIFV